MKPTHLIVHTAAFNKRPLTIEELRRWHVEGNGWSDIGYHWYIRKDGSIHEGRKENIQGAHCKAQGMNSKSLGVCFEGHGDYEEWTLKQEISFFKLYLDIKGRHDIPVENVKGHSEYDSGKTCPGLKIDMDEVRDKLHTKLTSRC